MAKMFYITCPKCSQQYYLEDLLYNKLLLDPKSYQLKCPFCKKDFYLELDQKAAAAK